MIKRTIRTGVALVIFGCVSCCAVAQIKPQQPNIVFILCDDLGYGDVQSLAPKTSKIKTPSIDMLARDGMVFTDAHSGSSVCTRIPRSNPNKLIIFLCCMLLQNHIRCSSLNNSKSSSY